MRSRVTARTDPLLHSRAMLSATSSTQQYISEAQRLIWVVVCLKNTIKKSQQRLESNSNYENETKRPKIHSGTRAIVEFLHCFAPMKASCSNLVCPNRQAWRSRRCSTISCDGFDQSLSRLRHFQDIDKSARTFSGPRLDDLPQRCSSQKLRHRRDTRLSSSSVTANTTARKNVRSSASQSVPAISESKAKSRFNRTRH